VVQSTARPILVLPSALKVGPSTPKWRRRSAVPRSSKSAEIWKAVVVDDFVGGSLGAAVDAVLGE
jgi:hypothetical protein